MKRPSKPAITGLLIMVALPGGVPEQPQPAPSRIAEVRVTSSDAAVFNALLHAFRTTSREKNEYYGNIGAQWQSEIRRGERPSLIDTNKHALGQSDKRMWDAEAQQEQKRFAQEHPPVPASCFRNAWERNAQPVILTHYQPTENVRVISQRTSDAFQETHYAAAIGSKESLRDYLTFRFSLPGYDTHRQRAFIYLDILDGSRHGGGSGWAFLSKINGKWQVSWCYLIYAA